MIHPLNGIEPRPGLRVRGLINRAELEIVSTNSKTTLLRDSRTGRIWEYGTEAFRRLQLEVVREEAHHAD